MQGLTANDTVELTILMPCLNEAETLALCIRKARLFLSRTGISGEILIADNGSIDGSRTIAENLWRSRRSGSQPRLRQRAAKWHPCRARSFCHHGR